MDRKSYKSKPQHIISDPRTGEIKRIVHPSDTDIGTSSVDANLRIYGDLSISGDTKTIDGSTLIAGGANVTVTTASNGQVTISAVAASGASAALSYVTVAAEGTLTSERVLTGGTGVKITDGGANSTITLNVHDGTVATVSGTNFTGIVNASGGISGSLQRTVAGLSYLVGGTNVTVSSASNGQVTISAAAASGAPSTAQYITLATDATLSAERVLVPSTGLFATDGGANGNYTIGVNDRIFAALTGSNFTGPAMFSGGLSGSLTRLQDGTSYIIAGSNVTVVTGSGGQITISSTGGSSGGGGDPGPSYLTLALTASLPNERIFTPGTGIKSTDAGAGAAYTLNINDGIVATISGSTFTGPITAVNNGGITGSITRLVGGTPFITTPAGNVISISTGSNGQIILSGSGGSNIGAPLGSAYVTIGTDTQLTSERSLTAGNGLALTDAGAGSTVTLAINNNVVATISGSTFTGPIIAVNNGGITGSITVTSAATPFITAPAGNVITVSTGSNGQIILSGTTPASGAPLGAQYLTLTADPQLTVERVFTAGTGLKATDGGAGAAYTVFVHDGTFASLSGSIFGGAITAATAGGITGSITQTTVGTPFITAPAGNAITVSTGSNGQVILSASISGGSGAPTTSAYVTIGSDASLSAERSLTAGTGLSLSDGGANSTVTLAINNNVVATISGSTFTGPITAVNNGGITGSITRLVGGTPFITVPSGNVITISTGSNGQIILSGSNIGAPLGSAYVTIGADVQLPGDRALTAGTGLTLTDGGAGSTATLAINNNVVATISGSTFTGAITAVLNGGITGSITRLVGGTPFITAPAGNIITITTGSGGQIILSGSGDGVENGFPPDYASLTGSTFTGRVTAAAALGFTGSLTQLVGGAPFITAVAGNVITITTGSGGQIIFSGSGGTSTGGSSGGGDPGAQYLVLAATASLSNERVFTPSAGLFSVDAGANGSFTLGVNDRFFAALTGSVFTGVLSASGGISGSIQQVGPGLSYLVGVGGTQVISQSNGQIWISSSAGGSGGGGASVGASYLQLSSDATNTSERTFTAGTGLRGTDAGANSTYTLAIDNSTVATISGSTFTGPVVGASNGGFTGSITRLAGGTPFITVPAGNMITVTTGSLGQIILSGSGDGVGNGFPPDYASLTGSTFTGRVIAAAALGFTGSLTQLVSGAPFITVPSGNVITVTTGSAGQIILSGSGGSNIGAPLGSAYITIGSDAQLTSERALTAGTGIILTDAGANSTITLGINNGIVATLTGSVFSGPIVASSTGGITGSITQLVGGTPFITAEAGNVITVRTGSNGQIIFSGSGGTATGGSSGGGDSGAQYLTLALTASLSNERVFTPSIGLFATDAGANGSYTLGVNDRFFAGISGSTFTGPVVGASNGGFTGSLTQLVGGTPFITAVAGNVITISTGSGGQIIFSGSGGINTGAPLGAQYLALATDPQLTSERIFTPGTGLRATDAGAGAAYTVNINDGTVATISGSTFTGAVTAASGFGFTGSLTRLVGGAPFITVVPNNIITISTGSGGQIILSGTGDGTGGTSGAPTTAQYLTLATDATLSVERVFTPGTGLKAIDGGAGAAYTLNINDSVIATISGSTFTGAITAAAAGGITGSITRLVGGTPFITVPSGNVITVSTGSNGQIILSGSGGSNIGAPLGSAYVTIGTDAQLTSERSLTAGTGLSLTDGGAGSTATLAINNNVVATISGSTFTGAITAVLNGGITGSITRLVGGTPYITVPAGNAVTVTTGSAGQIILSASISGGGSTSAGGSTGQFQINNASAFSGSAQFTYDTAGNRAVAGINGFEISNPAGTFGTVLRSAAVAADRILTFPLLTANDTGVTEAFTQTLTNKTLSTGTTGSAIQLRTRLDFNNPANTFAYQITPAAIAANRILNLPLLTATDTLAAEAFTQTLSNKTLTFSTGTILQLRTRLDFNNPANTFAYQITPGAIAANRILNIPVITATDTLAVLNLAQTFTNKTLTSPVINTPNFGANNITTTGTGTFSAGVVAGRVTLTSQNITTTPTINDAPLGTGVSTLSFSGAGPLTLTGIAGGVDGRMLFILNNSGDTLTMMNEDASSVAANRFTNAYSTDHIIQPGVSVVIIYFSTTARWHPCISF